VKYVTARLNLNPYDFSKFRAGEIASPRLPRLAPRHGDAPRERAFAGCSPDTVSRNARRFIVFDSLNAYNFGARLVRGNVVDSLGCARRIQVYRRLARARPTYFGL